MTTKQTYGFIALLAFTSFALQGQTTLNVRNGCNYYGAETETDYYQFQPNAEAQQIVNELLDGSGVSARSFILKESNCDNALATIVDGQRYILYNPNFLQKFKQDTATKWAAYGVLAHELGHHINNHNLAEENPTMRKQYELEADRYAGTLLFHLRATLGEAQSGINTIPLSGESNTHPSKPARLVATTNGWTAAYDLSRGVVQPKTVVPSVDNEKMAKEWFDKGYNETDNRKKIEYYTKAIEFKPDYAEAFSNRGVAKKNLGKYTDAIADYDQAIRLKSDLVFAFNGRGNAKYKLGQYKEAITDYDQAIRLNPDYANPFNGRGDAKQELKQYTEALADFDKAIELDAKYAKPYANKGCCLVAMNAKNRMGEAIDLINKGLALDSSLDYAKTCKAEAIKKLQE